MDASATFQIGESTYEVVSTRDMDFDEARIVKRLTGAGLGSYELAIADGDPDAWFAQILISLRRTNPRITEQQVNELLEGKTLVAIYKSMKEAEEDEPVPPVSAPLSDDAGGDAEQKNDDEQHAISVETPATAGSRP